MMDNQLAVWSWAFLLLYSLVMLGCGAAGMRLVKNSDDFATARGSYGPLFLAFAMTASTASGATFLGIPGLTYQYGVSGLWYAFIYPIAVYTGVAICLVIVSRAGKIFGSRSIPEYLGDRYQSPFLRVAMALFSLMLLFYLAGQIIAGTVMFHQMRGLTPLWAMLITVGMLIVYVTLGGAHADILTDALQQLFRSPQRVCPKLFDGGRRSVIRFNHKEAATAMTTCEAPVDMLRLNFDGTTANRAIHDDVRMLQNHHYLLPCAPLMRRGQNSKEFQRCVRRRGILGDTTPHAQRKTRGLTATSPRGRRN